MTRSKMISRSTLAALCAGVLGTAVAIAGTGSSQAATGSSEAAATSSTGVPIAIAVPDGHVLIADLAAEGVQVYKCNPADAATPWTFVEPAASLSGRTTIRPRSYQTAIHYVGPTWQSTIDGSVVTSKAVARSEVPGSIPELLLQTVTNRGDGIFGKVSYIQRLKTTGGAAPAGPCTEGKLVSVPYTAKYRFFAPK